MSDVQDRYVRVAEVFGRVLETGADGADRDALLDHLCGRDQTLRHEVQ